MVLHWFNLYNFTLNLERILKWYFQLVPLQINKFILNPLMQSEFVPRHTIVTNKSDKRMGRRGQIGEMRVYK